MDVPSPALRRVLRQARLYGHLQARDGRLFHPGGNKPLCRVEMAEEMVRAGWMKREADRYEITPEVGSDSAAPLSSHRALPRGRLQRLSARLRAADRAAGRRRKLCRRSAACPALYRRGRPSSACRTSGTASELSRTLPSRDKRGPSRREVKQRKGKWPANSDIPSTQRAGYQPCGNFADALSYFSRSGLVLFSVTFLDC